MIRRYLLFTIVVLLLFGAYYFLFRSEKETDSTLQQETPQTQTEEERFNQANFEKPDLIIGDVNAPVTIIEYADFKCPNCNTFFNQAGKQIRQDYIDQGKVKIIFRNFPFLGPDSGRAARGTYCADSQGVFAEYHDRIFSYVWDTYYSKNNYQAELEDVLTNQVLTNIMASALQDSDAFSACLDDEANNAFIDADLLQGAEHEANGTPTFIIGDQRIVGPANFTTFKTLIELALR